jgi:predicted HAD superfamily phosphohydrolase YqeG
MNYKVAYDEEQIEKILEDIKKNKINVFLLSNTERAHIKNYVFQLRFEQ